MEDKKGHGGKGEKVIFTGDTLFHGGRLLCMFFFGCFGGVLGGCFGEFGKGGLMRG